MPQSRKPQFSFVRKHLFVVSVFVLFFGVLTVKDYIHKINYKTKTYSKSPQYSKQTPPVAGKANVDINGYKITVDIANTDILRSKGLSFTEKLNENSGMLFVFDTPQKPFFWMKDMRFALDMIWINDNKIVDIDKNVPIPKADTPLNQLPKYSPKDTVNYVLEVNAGFCDKNNIKIGDSVNINF